MINDALHGNQRLTALATTIDTKEALQFYLLHKSERVSESVSERECERGREVDESGRKNSIKKKLVEKK